MKYLGIEYSAQTQYNQLYSVNVLSIIILDVGRYRSGQTGQTVNLLAYAFAGSSPARPTMDNRTSFTYYSHTWFALFSLATPAMCSCIFERTLFIKNVSVNET